MKNTFLTILVLTSAFASLAQASSLRCKIQVSYNENDPKATLTAAVSSVSRNQIQLSDLNLATSVGDEQKFYKDEYSYSPIRVEKVLENSLMSNGYGDDPTINTLARDFNFYDLGFVQTGSENELAQRTRISLWLPKDHSKMKQQTFTGRAKLTPATFNGVASIQCSIK